MLAILAAAPSTGLPNIQVISPPATSQLKRRVGDEFVCQSHVPSWPRPTIPTTTRGNCVCKPPCPCRS